MNSTVITVQWDGLDPCIHANGRIVLYRVQYTEVASGVVKSVNVTGEWNVDNAMTSLTELTPITNYSIQVAAVNEEDEVGVYSDPLVRQTNEDSESLDNGYRVIEIFLPLPLPSSWSSSDDCSISLFLQNKDHLEPTRETLWKYHRV